MSDPTLDFIVIGAQKAGTTALFEYMRPHPEVVVPPDKELPFFSEDRYYSRSWDGYYSATLPRRGPRQKRGTVTPQYMAGGVQHIMDPPLDDFPYDERTVPRRIQSRAPHARLIALLRDPVERAFSHYRMSVLKGLEERTFEEVVDALIDPGVLDRSRRVSSDADGYIVWGEYGRILRGYYDVFPREQIMVLFSADLAQSRAATLRRVFEFIGVSPDFVPGNLDSDYNVGSTKRRLSWLDVNAIRDAARGRAVPRVVWRSLPKWTHRHIHRAWGVVDWRVQEWNRDLSTDSQRPSAEVLDRLHAHFASDTDVLSELIGCPLPWTRPAGG